MAFVGDLPVFFVIISVVAIIAVVTEFSSNTAVASVFLPVLATMAAASNSHPMLFLFSGTVASSFAYMLPSGTGTNAVVFASGRVTIPAMARVEFTPFFGHRVKPASYVVVQRPRVIYNRVTSGGAPGCRTLPNTQKFFSELLPWFGSAPKIHAPS